MLFKEKNYDFIKDFVDEEVSDPSKVVNSINNILDLITSIKKTNSYRIVIKSYYYNHLLSCIDPDCPLYHKKSTLQFEKEEEDKILGKILHKCFSYLSKATSENPNDIQLGLYYALFLIEHINNNSLAIIELNQMAQSSPNPFQDFYIYRYRQVVTNALLNFANEESEKLRIKNALSYDSQFNSLRKKIIRITYLYTQIW